ncbi:hypothetical protein ACFL0R_06580 [Pseudomonadota bacterium]
MKIMKPEHRLTYVNISLLSLIGIWLTGFNQVHWSIYIAPGALLFAAISGYCIGFDISKMALKLLDINTEGHKAKSI